MRCCSLLISSSLSGSLLGSRPMLYAGEHSCSAGNLPGRPAAAAAGRGRTTPLGLPASLLGWGRTARPLGGLRYQRAATLRRDAGDRSAAAQRGWGHALAHRCDNGHATTCNEQRATRPHIHALASPCLATPHAAARCGACKRRIPHRPACNVCFQHARFRCGGPTEYRGVVGAGQGKTTCKRPQGGSARSRQHLHQPEVVTSHAVPLLLLSFLQPATSLQAEHTSAGQAHQRQAGQASSINGLLSGLGQGKTERCTSAVRLLARLLTDVRMTGGSEP